MTRTQPTPSTSSWWWARATVLALAVLVAAALAAMQASPARSQVTFTQGPNTVSTPRFEWNFGDNSGNVERVDGVQWRDSAGNLGPNLTRIGGGTCAGEPNEQWGQSAANFSPFVPAPTGAGTTGTWTPIGNGTVEMNSTRSTSCNGGDVVTPVRTRYTFYDTGPSVNKIRVERRFEFNANTPNYPGADGFRAYIPRLPVAYSRVIHPNSSGTALVDDPTCGFGCTTPDWNGTWFAINHPTTNAGMVVLRDPNNAVTAATILRDDDGGSGSNLTSVSLNRPGTDWWKAPITETEYLCFYDATSWPVASRSATSLPPGCGPNTPPEAANDAYSTDEDATLDVPAPGVLGNDTDAQGDGMQAVKVTDPSNGTLDLDPDGSFTYEPDEDFNGEDTFTYKTSDGEAQGNTATVSIDVAGSNDAPTISDVANQTTSEGTATGQIPFTVGDVDNAPGTLTVTGASSNDDLVPDANVEIGGSGANRTVRVTPAPNKTGTAQITLTVTDAGGLSATDTFVLTVSDTTAPTVTSANPASGATKIRRTSNVGVTFSEAMDLDSLKAAGVFTLKNTKTGATVPAASIILSPDGKTVTFDPSPAKLSKKTRYEVRITTGARDTAGNALAADKVYSFTTKKK